MADYYVDKNGCTIRAEKNKKIAYFNCKLVEVTEYCDFNNITLYKEYKVEFRTTEFITEKEISDKELNSFDYDGFDDRLLTVPNIKNVKKELAFHIKSQVKNALYTKAIIFEQLGWHSNKNGVHCYCAGNKIISTEKINDYVIKKSISEKYRLEIDKNLNERYAVQSLIKAMNISVKYTSVIVVNAFVGIMRQPLLDAYIHIPSVLYIQSNSQMGKTSVVIFCTRLYNRLSLRSDPEIGRASCRERV